MAAIDLASGLTSDNAQALKAAVDNADGQAVSALLNQAAVVAKNMVFNGASWDRLRTPNVFKLLSAVVITSETTIWTPAAGKKFRLMGFLLTQGILTGSVALRDNTGGTIIFRIPPNTIAVVIPDVLFGNGILSAAANNVLTATGASGETLDGTIFGTEE